MVSKPSLRITDTGRISLVIALLFLATASLLGAQFWHWSQSRSDESATLAFGRSLGATVEPVMIGNDALARNSDRLPAGMVVLSESDVGAIAWPPVHVGDVIERINGMPVRSQHELATALARADRHRPLALLIWRHGQEFLTRLRRL
jgi:hypothetical protein